MKSPPTLILASTSHYRRALLQRVGLAFTCVAPGVDETPRPGERAGALAARLARAKATAVAAAHPGACVIGSDQVAVMTDAAEGDAILGKPPTAAACFEQLRRCAGRSVDFLTAVTVLTHDATPQEFVDTTRVAFRRLDDAAIERYVTREMPLDCAAGFKSESLGITLCESIVSEDPSALIGLPLIRLTAALCAAGFALP